MFPTWMCVGTEEDPVCYCMCVLGGKVELFLSLSRSRLDGPLLSELSLVESHDLLVVRLWNLGVLLGDNDLDV